MNTESIRHQLLIEYESAVDCGELSHNNEHAYRLEQLKVQAQLLQVEVLEKLIIQVNMLATTIAQIVEGEMK